VFHTKASAPRGVRAGNNTVGAVNRLVSFRIERVLSEDQARGWHAIEEVAIPADHPGLLADPLQEILAMLPEGVPSFRAEFYLGYDGYAVVANGSVFLPMLDNLHMSHISVTVPPALRRQGFGRQMFAALRERIRGIGRETIVGSTGGPFGSVVPGERFARAVGAQLAQSQLRSELRFDSLDRRLLEDLLLDAQSHASDYEIVQWVDHAPEAVIDDWAILIGRMALDAPMGDLDWRAEHWDASRCREWEDETINRGRMRLVTGARHRSSHRLVACTDIGVPQTRTNIAYQWDTIVVPEHRGHRLGILVKILNLDALERNVDGVESVQTWNAADNTFMLAVNRAMGFEPVEEYAAWQMTA